MTPHFSSMSGDGVINTCHGPGLPQQLADSNRGELLSVYWLNRKALLCYLWIILVEMLSSRPLGLHVFGNLKVLFLDCSLTENKLLLLQQSIRNFSRKCSNWSDG